MSLPQPQTALNDACSVIFNNTLYTYSADAFQSLRLEPGAEWTKLPQGEKVTGGVCVGSTTGTASTSAFFVVGGIAKTAEYKGLQKYTYATGQWETIRLPVPVTDRRVGHGAVYINSTDSILVYAGAQDGSRNPSSQTFTIGASAPHAVLAFDSGAPPSVKPILLPWSSSEAVMIGGSTWNTRVMLFSSEKKWVDSRASLAAPLLKDTSAIQAVVVTGDDGSKNLITFDMSESPNEVARTVLCSAGGVPVPKAATVQRRTARRKGRDPVSHQSKDDAPLTVNNWPAYNSTLAPTVTRNNFALAEGSDGTVVMAGGNGDDDDVLCIFNVRKNCWENASEKLAQFRLLSTDTSSASSSATATTTATTTPTSTSTISSTSVVTASEAGAAAATQSPTETAAPTVTSSSGPPLNTILGAVLGAVFGLAVLLVLVYLCIRRRRRRQAHAEAGHLRRGSGASPTEKGGIGFARDSLALGQGAMGGFRGHQSQDSHSSLPSLAILMGLSGQQKSTPSRLSRKPSNDSRRDSSDSTFRAFKSTIGKPIPQLRQPARDDEGDASAASTEVPKERNQATGATRRSSGWNRYWSGGSALNLLGFGGGSGNVSGPANNSRRTTAASERSSQYSDTHRMTQDSATVPPLQVLNEPRMSFSRVTTRSPTIAVYGEKLREGMSGQIETQRPVSAVSAVSELSASAYSSGIPESVHDAWDPTATNRPWGADRALNGSLPGLYSTPLAPASQGQKTSAQAPAQPQRQPQAPMRDDMSWLNLGGS